MDLIVNQVMKLQVMHVADRNSGVKILACTAVTKLYLSVSGDRDTFPQFSVLKMIAEILHKLRICILLVLGLEVFPGAVDVIVGHLQRILDIAFVRTVEDRSGDVETERLGCKAQMNLKDLTDIHTGRNAQRVEHNVKRTSVRQERHVFNRKYAGYNTLVSVTAGHLITDGDLSLLCNVNADRLVHTRRKLVALGACKYLCVHNDTIFTVRYLQRSVSYFTLFLTEDRAEQSLLSCQLGLTFRCYLTYKDIAGTDLGTDTDNTAFIQVFQRFIAYTRDVASNLFRSEFCITGFRLILLNVDGSIDVILNKPF